MSDTIISCRLDGDLLVVETRDGVETYDSQFLVAALLVYIARGSGEIQPEETATMLDLIEEHFRIGSADSLQFLTRAISELAEKPELRPMLVELGRRLGNVEKEEIALMALKVIAADGRRDVNELERFNESVEALNIPPEVVHRAFDRYFSETMPGS